MNTLVRSPIGRRDGRHAGKTGRIRRRSAFRLVARFRRIRRSRSPGRRHCSEIAQMQVDPMAKFALPDALARRRGIERRVGARRQQNEVFR